MSEHKTLPGYEEVAFFGRNSHSCLRPDEASDPCDAAHKHAAKYVKAYVIECQDGWEVYADLEAEKWENLPPEHRAAVQEWLDTPLEEHIERWKRGEKWKRRAK